MKTRQDTLKKLEELEQRFNKLEEIFKKSEAKSNNHIFELNQDVVELQNTVYSTLKYEPDQEQLLLDNGVEISSSIYPSSENNDSYSSSHDSNQSDEVLSSSPFPETNRYGIQGCNIL